MEQTAKKELTNAEIENLIKKRRRKCVVIRCDKERIRGGDGFCREHYLKINEKL